MSITKTGAIVVVAAALGAALGGCAEEVGFAACDVRERDCQERTFNAVVALRGGSAAMPRITVVDQAGLLARMELHDEKESEDEAAARALTYERWSRGLALFRLAPADYDQQQAMRDWSSEVGGGYFPGTKEIVIVDRGGKLEDEGAAVEILAHEFVHALQDAEHDLATLGDDYLRTFDSSLALSSIIEGEAVLYQALASATLAGFDYGYEPQRLNWYEFYERYQRSTLERADADPAPVNLARMRFPYAFGGSFVTQHWLARGPAGITALFANPPLSTYAVMFGDEHGMLPPAQEEVREVGVPVLDGDFEEVSSTALGAWMTRMFAARMGVTGDARLEVAKKLDADWFSVQSGAEEAVVAAWRVRPRKSLESLDSWPGLRGRAAIQGYSDGGLHEVLLLAASTAAPVEALAWQAPTGAAEPDDEMPAAGFAAAVPFDWRFGLGCSRARVRFSTEVHAHAAR